jgi:hypothetical protein
MVSSRPVTKVIRVGFIVGISTYYLVVLGSLLGLKFLSTVAEMVVPVFDICKFYKPNSAHNRK